ncbi:lipoprotein [Williamsoniiplasma luminosum]|uniref:Lipoprotein n=1 Tax=Williamsoniiplasma luminosum TaxID=214888 RepID=A0A2S0NJM5_9MOLU|nr:lipoprotein [Williamsoniiplasma luminosum]AVP49223.1 MAG: hypothetical protein C5T88_01340 [Williamsoniiplasma luminosum]
MKKLMTILASFSLTIPTALTVVACNKQTPPPTVTPKPIPEQKINLTNLIETMHFENLINDNAQTILTAVEKVNSKSKGLIKVEDIGIGVAIIKPLDLKKYEGEIPISFTIKATVIPKPHLSKLLKNPNLGYLKNSDIENIKGALYVKNDYLTKKQIENLYIANTNDIEAVIKDKSGNYSGGVKLFFNTKFDHEFVVDEKNRISAEELGLESFKGELKAKGEQDLYLYREGYTGQFVDLEQKKALSFPEGIKDIAWVSGNTYLAIDNSTDDIKIFDIIDGQWTLKGEVKIFYNGEKPKNYYWSLINRIDEENFAIVKLTTKPEEWDSITMISINWGLNTAEAAVQSGVMNSKVVIGINKSFSGVNNDEIQYIANIPTALIFKKQVLTINSSVVNNMPLLPKDIKYISNAKLFRDYGSGNHVFNNDVRIVLLPPESSGFDYWRIIFSTQDRLDQSIPTFGKPQGGGDYPGVQWKFKELGEPLSVFQDKKGNVWVNTQEYIYPIVHWTYN